MSISPRLEGDEFTCLLEGVTCRGDMDIVAKRLLEFMSKPFMIQEEAILLTASIGLAVYPLDGLQADELIQKAQGALNAVHESGGANYRFPDALEK